MAQVHEILDGGAQLTHYAGFSPCFFILYRKASRPIRSSRAALD
jgi:hypothetical protein